jgi:hypothetical protein
VRVPFPKGITDIDTPGATGNYSVRCCRITCGIKDRRSFHECPARRPRPAAKHLDIIFLNATTSTHTTLQARSKRLSGDAVRLMEQHVASDNEGQWSKGITISRPSQSNESPSK